MNAIEKTPLDLLSLALPSSKDIRDHVEIKNGLFTLSDPRTCDEPRRSDHCPESCDRVILNIKSLTDIAVLRFDEWQHLSDNEKYDYLLFDIGTDLKRISLCELTCSLEKYVIPDSTRQSPGKREKAFSQISNTWNKIKNSDNPVFANFLLQFREKTGIFGWRDRSTESDSSAAAKSMRTFTRTPGSDSGIKIFPQHTIDGIFTLMQVKYPSIFNW